MNVLIVTDAFPPGAGGSGRSTAALAKALRRRGHHVRVVVARTKGREQREWQGVEVDEVLLPASSFGNARARETFFAEGLKRAVGEEAWDLVHAQHWLSAGATRRACPRLPMVVTVRDYWPVCIWSTKMSGLHPCPGCSYGRRVVCVGRRHPYLWPVAPLLPPVVGRELARRRHVLREAKAVIAVSRHVAEELPIPDAHVLPNLLDVPVLEDLRRPDDVPERFVLFVGKLEPNKAADRLVPILEAAHCELPLIVAGTGRLERDLHRQAKEASKDVRFLGWVDEERVLALLHHASAVLFPSRWQEPLARVVLDGLGAGAVLIVEPSGGNEEALVDGESGLLGRSVPELGEALARALSDDSLRLALREGARRRAESLFSEDVVLPKLEELYRGVAES